MANLTLERRLVTKLDEPRSRAGHYTVIFREESGGRVLHRVLDAGEPFRPRWLERLGRYQAYAVSANPVLRHHLSKQLKTGVGERRDVFNVDVTIAFRVSRADLLAEGLEGDPLGQLETELKTLLLEWASTFSFDMLADRSFDAEAHFLQSRLGTDRAAGKSRSKRLRDFAAVLGIEITEVDLTREFSMDDWGAARVKLEQERLREVEDERQKSRIQATEHAKEIQACEAFGRAQVNTLEVLVAGFGHALDNVARDTNTPSKLREAVRQILQARSDISAAHFSQVALSERSERPALSAGGGRGQRSSGDGSALVREVRRMQEVAGDLDCSPAERIGLVGRLLHVLAELCLVDESRNGNLDEHSGELGRYFEHIRIESAIREPDHLSFLRRYREPQTLRAELAAELGIELS